MNLHIKIPLELEQSLRAAAVAAGKDVETYVVESLQESLANSETRHNRAASFLTWLNEVRELVPPNINLVDDSRESIYAGRI